MRQLIKLILLCLMVSPPLYSADYRFVRIDVPKAIYSDARGINARGDIVGSYLDVDDISHGFLLRNGTFWSIDVPNAEITRAARGINARGDIVGSFIGADFFGHGYLLIDGQFTQIDFPGASDSFLLGINNAGDLAGTYFDAMGNTGGYIFKDGEFQNVNVPGSLTTFVNFAQDNGHVLVGQATMPPDGGFHGFVIYKPGDFDMIDFPGLSVPCTGARWINQRGDIVGGFAFAASVEDCPSAPHHGFILRDGQYTQIDFPGSIWTRALAINDDGVIVGEFTDKKGNGHGFKAMPED